MAPFTIPTGFVLNKKSFVFRSWHLLQSRPAGIGLAVVAGIHGGIANTQASHQIKKKQCLLEFK